MPQKDVTSRSVKTVKQRYPAAPVQTSIQVSGWLKLSSQVVLERVVLLKPILSFQATAAEIQWILSPDSQQ